MADTNTYTSKQNIKKYTTQTKFDAIDKSDIPAGTEYNIVGAIEESDLSSELQTKVNRTTAQKADTLTTPRSISLDTALDAIPTDFDGSGNISIPVTGVKEAYLQWGGKNFTGSYGPIDAAMIPELGANRFAFINPGALTIEYSRDGGTTWVDYGASDIEKVALFSTTYRFTIGKSSASDKAQANYMLRITANSASSGVYTELNKFAIFVSTEGSTGSYCTIQTAKKATPTTFNTIADKVQIAGWSGWNIINNAYVVFGNNTDTQDQYLRFIFGCTGVSAEHSGLAIYKIRCFGGVGWGTNSNMAGSGNLFSYDARQNATFPTNVIATEGFIGNLVGSATALKITKNNELVLDGSSTQPNVWFGYSYASGAGKQITEYIFGDGTNTGGLADITAKSFKGPLNGNASSATNDKNGLDITNYIKELSISGTTITYTKGDGTTGTIDTVPDNYVTNTTYASNNRYGVAKIWFDTTDNYLYIRTDGN